MNNDKLVLATMESYYRHFEAVGRTKRHAYRTLYRAVACYCQKNHLNFDVVFDIETIFYKNLKIGQAFLDNEIIYDEDDEEMK